MAKYRKKPVVVEAVRWFKNGDHPEVGVLDDPKIQANCKMCSTPLNGHGWIETLEGGVVCVGDWIITGVNGEHYPCRPDIFEKTYEPEPEPYITEVPKPCLYIVGSRASKNCHCENCTEWWSER